MSVIRPTKSDFMRESSLKILLAHRELGPEGAATAAQALADALPDDAFGSGSTDEIGLTRRIHRLREALWFYAADETMIHSNMKALAQAALAEDKP